MNTCDALNSQALFVKLPKLVMISQHEFRKWLHAVSQQAITLAYPDPCHHMASLGHKEFITICPERNGFHFQYEYINDTNSTIQHGFYIIALSTHS